MILKIFYLKVKKMKKKNVAKIARDILLNDKNFNHLDSIYYGDLDVLHEIYDQAGLSIKNNHPLNVHQAVLNGLDSHCKCKKPLFRKIYFRSFKGLARGFELIEKYGE